MSGISLQAALRRAERAMGSTAVGTSLGGSRSSIGVPPPPIPKLQNLQIKRLKPGIKLQDLQNKGDILQDLQNTGVMAFFGALTCISHEVAAWCMPRPWGGVGLERPG